MASRGAPRTVLFRMQLRIEKAIKSHEEGLETGGADIQMLFNQRLSGLLRRTIQIREQFADFRAIARVRRWHVVASPKNFGGSA